MSVAQNNGCNGLWLNENVLFGLIRVNVSRKKYCLIGLYTAAPDCKLLPSAYLDVGDRGTN